MIIYNYCQFFRALLPTIYTVLPILWRNSVTCYLLCIYCRQIGLPFCDLESVWSALAGKSLFMNTKEDSLLCTITNFGWKWLFSLLRHSSRNAFICQLDSWSEWPRDCELSCLPRPWAAESSVSCCKRVGQSTVDWSSSLYCSFKLRCFSLGSWLIRMYVHDVVADFIVSVLMSQNIKLLPPSFYVFHELTSWFRRTRRWSVDWRLLKFCRMNPVPMFQHLQVNQYNSPVFQLCAGSATNFAILSHYAQENSEFRQKCPGQTSDSECRTCRSR